MDLDEFNDYVTEVLDTKIPSVLMEGLNLGVIVNPNINIDTKESQFIIMGLYVRNRLGKQIILYYGSFLYFYRNKSVDTWKKKILSTIKHELTHHIEGLAGQEDLANKEIYEAYLRQKEKSKKKKSKNKD